MVKPIFYHNIYSVFILLKILILASIYLSQYNTFLPLDLLIQPRMSPTDVETPLFHAPKHDTGIIHIIRMSHSKILIDFSTSTWPQSSIKTVTGASFFNPEQTCQNEEKNLRTNPDMPSLCCEFTFKFSPAEQRPERGKVTTFLHYISPCSSSLFPRGSCNSGEAFSGWVWSRVYSWYLKML